ncbi:twin-arginine translocation signal domain-containing protein [Streptomyces sp. NPDC005438]|uniref:twin-arginine translocation signal domain-containing protein n=1 Tax=Streptomyces sp. NPDC005438 TaxID=3156880 RepID=UPI0033B72C11
MTEHRPQQAPAPAAPTSRRRFLGAAAAGLVGAAVAVPVLTSGSASAAPEKSSTAAGIDPFNGEPLDASVDCELSGRKS